MQRHASMACDGGEPFAAEDVCFRCMSLFPRKALLAIAAVIDVALRPSGRPISAKNLAVRHGLPPRHLETVLQSLVRDGILKGIRGPHGGYELARERRHISANDILRAAGTVDKIEEGSASDFVMQVVIPALSAAEIEFGRMLSRISLEDMARHAESLNASHGRVARN